MVKSDNQDKIHKFIDWLIKWKTKRNELWTDKDSYAIGLYVVYLAYGDENERI